MQILVLGMHRSGTSLVSGLLNLMGAYLGPEKLLGSASYDNQKGFWERLDVKDINNRMLALVNCDWNNISGLDLNLISEKTSYEYSTIERIVAEMNENQPWAIKDPRMCLLLPLWRRFLDNPVCIIVSRSPIEVAMSLYTRNKMPLHQGIALWEAYTLSMLQNSADMARIIVHYDDFTSNPLAAARSLFEELLSCGIDKLSLPEDGVIKNFIDRDLHHEIDDNDQIKEFLNIRQFELYEALQNKSILNWSTFPSFSKGGLSAFEDINLEISKLENEVAEKKAHEITLQNTVASQNKYILALNDQLKTLRNDYSNREYDIVHLRRCINDVLSLNDSLFASIRWKAGNLFARAIEACLFRKNVITARELILDLKRRYFDWALQYDNLAMADSGSIQDVSAVPIQKHSKYPALNQGPSNLCDIFVFPVIDWNFRFQRPQHIAKELGKKGYRVFFMAPRFIRPVGEGYNYEILESPADNVFIIKLRTKNAIKNIYENRMSDALRNELNTAIMAIKRDMQIPQSVSIVEHSFWRPLAEIIDSSFLVYDCMDNHAGFRHNSRHILSEEEALIRSADKVIVTADKLFEMIKDIRPAVMIPNAVEYEHFSDKPSQLKIASDRPVVGYLGAISSWFDIDLVVEAANVYPDWDFHLVGEVTDLSIKNAEKLSNIHFWGEVPYEDAPSYVHAFDVCIIPFKINELTECTNPIKAYEYLAAGKPVVTTDMHDLRGMHSEIRTAETAQKFIEALKTAMDEHSSHDLIHVRQQWAKGHSWTNRAQQFEDVIHSCFPKVSVIVLTFNNLVLTKACIQSLKNFTAYPNWELLVVDNASSDDTVDYLKGCEREIPNMRLIENADNLGFSGGNNIGLREATGDYLVILNNDIYTTEGWLGGLIRHLERDDQLGIVGAVTNMCGNEAQIDIEYMNMDDMQKNAREYTSSHARKLLYVDTVAFFCVAFRRRLFDEIGGLDESFKIGYFEDDDYCRRARLAGFKVAIAEDVFVHHEHSGSFSKLSVERRNEIFEANKLVYEKKWGEWKAHKYRQ